MTLKIQGTIVSPDYDDEYFSAWIDRGIITPSSRVVSQIETADEPIDLYINSYGGDVFAGGEMQIALVKAAVAGKLRTCEVGSIAASMAANIVAALRANGVSVEGHVNSQLMFHGCYTETVGGAQHHEDVAESLRNINDCVITNLKRCGVEECRAWFAEGREKWMAADEALSLNLFTSIAETDAQAPAEAKQTAARLAAFASSVMSRTEYKSMIDETIKAEEPKPETAEQTAAPETAPEAAPAVEAPKEETTTAETPVETVAPTADELEEKVTALANERFAKLQSAHDKMISDIKVERDAALKDLEVAKATATSLQADIEKLERDLAEVRDQLAKSEQNRESVVVKSLTPTNVKKASWTEAYKAAKRNY